jgi:hypothetical protein
MLGFRRPSSDDKVVSPAEQRWLAEETRLRRRLGIATTAVAAGIIATCVTASLGQLALARVCAIAVFAGMARVIYLIIGRRRRFIDIKMAGA